MMTDYAALVKAERSAASLAYYFGTTDLHDEYEKAQAETDTALAALVAERDALRAQLATARKQALKEAADAVAAAEIVMAIGWDNVPVDPYPFEDIIRALLEVGD